MTTNNGLDGLDMAGTIKWYGQNVGTVLGRLPNPANTQTAGVQFTVHGRLNDLDIMDLYGVIQRFPIQARRRMNVRSVTMMESLWFSQDSKPNVPQVTTTRHDAISTTAIVPSYVHYRSDTTQWCGYSGDIQLYAIRKDAAVATVQRIIHLQGLCHELAHCLVTPELYKNCTLMLPDAKGTIITSDQWFVNFSNLANKFGPISHYVRAYYDEHGRLLEEPNPLLPINEAMAETITAYLLGFAYKPNGNGLNPFEGECRKELMPLIRDYLYAMRIS